MKIETSKRFSFRSSLLSPSSLLIFSFCLCFAVINLSCGSKTTDLRTLVPAETLVYLETNDLAAALQPIVDSKPFTEVAKRKPDFSALRGVQLAVAVTGFETSEEKLTDEHSVGRVQPHFVAVADTHAWHFQAVGFAEQKIGAFVAEMYDNEPTLEKPEKNGGRSLTWTAKDGRKAYAFVIGSIIYFGNDETAIEKCLAVKRGEADSIAKTGKVQSASQEILASGYVSTDGIAQIANIAGLKFASEAGEDSEVQSAIAGILPQLIRGSITDITWRASQTNEGIEDKFIISMPPEIANVLSETMIESGKPDLSLLKELPDEVSTLSIYDLRDPQVAWRSIVLVVQKQLNPLAAKTILAILPSFFEPYAIKDGEMFLNSVGPTILTAKLAVGNEGQVVIATVKNSDTARKSLISVFKPAIVEYMDGKLEVFKSVDGDYAAKFWQDRLIIGETDPVMKCLGYRRDLAKKSELIDRISGTSRAAIHTISHDYTTAAEIADLMAEKKSDDAKAESTYFTETRFTKSGIERRTVSDFGLIGSIIAQLAQD